MPGAASAKNPLSAARELSRGFIKTRTGSGVARRSALARSVAAVVYSKPAMYPGLLMILSNSFHAGPMRCMIFCISERLSFFGFFVLVLFGGFFFAMAALLQNTGFRQ
jgi:hypothetical protein